MFVTKTINMTQQPIIYWFRNDLRLHDNPALHKALSVKSPIIPVFIFDDKWWAPFPELDFPRIADHRLAFLYETVLNLSEQIQKAGNHLLVFKGDPVTILQELYVRCDAQAICNSPQAACCSRPTRFLLP
jgi:deoxyribodipyrimidine photo-lyase